MERLQTNFDKLLRETTTDFHRYMFDAINWDARMIGLVGPRGVGKTTLVLQHIKEVFFFSLTWKLLKSGITKPGKKTSWNNITIFRSA